MGLFDNFFNNNNSAASAPDAFSENRTETFSFAELPESLEQLKALPEASLDTPFKTAALTVCALCVYAASSEIGVQMLNFLKGPAPLTPYQISFINDRFMDSKLVPFSYFEGAVPENNYVPNKPFKVAITSNAHSKRDDTHITLWIKSGGADSPRNVALRLKPSENKWYLDEQHLLVGIRPAKSADAWA